MELVEHVFSKFQSQRVEKEDILDMMEQFGLIAKYTSTATSTKYFVPAQLKTTPKSICKLEPSPSDPCPLYLHFAGGFVPHGLFTQLVSRFISWCCKTWETTPPSLYRNGAWFVVEKTGSLWFHSSLQEEFHQDCPQAKKTRFNRFKGRISWNSQTCLYVHRRSFTNAV